MVRNVFTVISGTVIAQVILLVSLPFLTRVYDAAAFGLFQIYATSINVLLMFVALRFEVAFLSVADDERFSKLLRLTVRLCFVTSIVAALVSLLVASWVRELAPQLGTVIYLLPPAMLIAGIFQTLSLLPIRNRQYGLSARSKIVQSLGWSLSAFSSIPLRAGGVGLIVADMIARVAATVALLHGTKGALSTAIGPLSSREAGVLVRQYREYPTITFPGTLLSSLVAAMAPFAFLAIFSLEAAGQFSLVERFILLPAGVFVAAVGQVFTGDFSRMFRDDRNGLYRKFLRALFTLCVIAAVLCVLGYVYAPSVVPIFFGEQWALAAELSAPAMLLVLTTMIASPFHMVLTICGRFRAQILWEITRFMFIGACFLVLHQGGVRNPVTVMWTYACATFLSYVVYLVMADRAVCRASRAQ